jgi:holo-[acyl-carrier protein] synthase
VQRAEGERPSVQLSGRARQRADALGVRTIALSLSHARQYAVAVVVLER